MHLPSITGLYWSMLGEVACEAHAPYPDDSRWSLEGWSPLPASSAHLPGTRYQCQHCAIDSRAVVHQGKGPH